MKQSKFLNILLLLVILSSMLGRNASEVRAELPVELIGTKPDEPVKINRADSEAAATLESVAKADMNMDEAPGDFSHPNYANSLLLGNVVSDWNAIAQEILQPTSMMMGGISMATAFVYLGYTQAAVYDALLAIEGGYQPYAYVPLVIEPTASREAAVAAATYTVLSYYFTLHGNLEAIPAHQPG